MTSQNEDQDEKPISIRFHSQYGITIDQPRSNALMKTNGLKEQCRIKEIDATISFGSVTWHDGSTYTGCFKNSKRFGFGSMTWPDGSTYAGNWNNDDMNGEGKYENKNSFNCSGSWQEGLQKIKFV